MSFLSEYTIAIEARMADARDPGIEPHPSITVWVVPIFSPDKLAERRPLMTIHFVPGGNNPMVFYGPDGEVLADNSNGFPHGMDINGMLNEAWDKAESVLMDRVGEIVAGTSEMMRLAQAAAQISGAPVQDVFNEMSKATGFHIAEKLPELHVPSLMERAKRWLLKVWAFITDWRGGGY